MQAFFFIILTVSGFRLCWFRLFYTFPTSMHTLHMLIRSICRCPSHIMRTTLPKGFSPASRLQSPVAPSTSLASCPSSWGQPRSAFSVKVSTDANWSLINWLSSLKSDPKQRDFCEKVWERTSAMWDVPQRNVCLTYLYSMFYTGWSPLLPLQRRDRLCPPTTCRGRRGGPGPTSEQLKGYEYLFSEYVMDGGVFIQFTPTPVYFSFQMLKWRRRRRKRRRRRRRFVYLNMYLKKEIQFKGILIIAQKDKY